MYPLSLSLSSLPSPWPWNNLQRCDHTGIVYHLSKDELDKYDAEHERELEQQRRSKFHSLFLLILLALLFITALSLVSGVQVAYLSTVLAFNVCIDLSTTLSRLVSAIQLPFPLSLSLSLSLSLVQFSTADHISLAKQTLDFLCVLFTPGELTLLLLLFPLTLF